MKIKITHTEGEYLAGLIYDVEEKKARELIAAEKAFEFADEVIEVTALINKEPVFVEGVKSKKVKHDDR